MNYDFLIVALVVGRAVDWIFQSQWQANNKTKNFFALLEHSFIYTVWVMFFTITSLQMHGNVYTLIFILDSLLLSHMIIDNRWVIKRIMMLKGLSRHQVYSGEFNWLELGIDQRLHDVVILIIAMVI